MKSDSHDSVSTHSPKIRTRQVSSRFMSPNPTGSPERGSASATNSPFRRFPSRGHRWPSTAKRNSTTLADHIGDERLREREHHNHHHNQNQKATNRTNSVFSSLTKQRSCRELSNNNNNSNGFEENDQPIIGRSMRYSFPGKSSSLGKKQSYHMVPGRLSLDENALQRNSDYSRNSIDSESDNTSFNYLPRTWSYRKVGKDVQSKYMATSSLRGRASDSDISNSKPLSSDESWVMKKLISEKAMKKANSLIGYMSSKSQWALSPGRSGSPPMSLESKDKPLSFSSLRPQNKSVEKILSMGFDLFRSKKSSTSVGLANSEAVHQLRLLDNRLIQWRFANARAHAVNDNMSLQAESNLICALDGIAKLQRSVVQKKIELEREKLEMKLNFVLHSQMKLLETWASMERQHLAAISLMKQCLHSVICKVPLLEGAKVDIQWMSIAQRHASDLTASIKSVLSCFSPLADKNAELLSELAKIVAQEKLLLQEFNDLFQTMCVLELKERSLKCSFIQLKC
ncbi:QWRF motif-containing protein 3-like [Abrus precatorius]|uniref:QWRF motif-containing protein 3-like n=1 Tax=Abrus precatorius TaxID=3816 RepID=A0A8B8KW74_ABRPR|nr:QWRF motif-containing protein 3-like [Abrus precatorius]